MLLVKWSDVCIWTRLSLVLNTPTLYFLLSALCYNCESYIIAQLNLSGNQLVYPFPFLWLPMCFSIFIDLNHYNDILSIFLLYDWLEINVHVFQRNNLLGCSVFISHYVFILSYLGYFESHRPSVYVCMIILYFLVTHVYVW